MIPVGVLAVSDIAFRGPYEDKGRPGIATDPAACTAFPPPGA